MMDEQTNGRGEESLAELLRMAGPRPRIPDDVKARIRAAAHDEWQMQTARRRRTRVLSGLVAAATLAGALFLFRGRELPVAPQAPPVVARVQTVDGSVSAAPGQNVVAGAVIQTAAGSTASLSWGGATLRLDGGTRLRLESSTSALLLAGAVYFSDDQSRGPREIRTSFGTVRDVGTQFEVRLQENALRVRVREGRVEIVRGSHRSTAEAGTEIVATAASVVQHSVRGHGDEWAWVERAAPSLTLEGMTLGDVLQRIAREKGLTLDLQQDAAATRLRGQVPFSPDEALAAASAAAGVQYRIEDDRLIVRRQR